MRTRARTRTRDLHAKVTCGRPRQRTHRLAAAVEPFRKLREGRKLSVGACDAAGRASVSLGVGMLVAYLWTCLAARAGLAVPTARRASQQRCTGRPSPTPPWQSPQGASARRAAHCSRCALRIQCVDERKRRLAQAQQAPAVRAGIAVLAWDAWDTIAPVIAVRSGHTVPAVLALQSNPQHAWLECAQSPVCACAWE